MRNAYLVIDVVIAVGLLSLGVVSLLRQGYKNPINRLFAWFSVLVALWIVSNNFSNDIGLPSQVALWANYLVFSSSFGVLIVFMQFITKLASAHKLEYFAKRLAIPLWVMCLIGATPLVVGGLIVQGDVYAVIFGPLFWLYAFCIFIMIAIITYGIVHGLRHAKGVRRRQLRTISIGLAVALPLVLLFSLIIPSFTGLFAVTEFGITPTIILVFSLYYGVVRYGLFDIRLAMVRTVAYALSLLTLSVIYYYLAYIVSLLFFQGEVNSSVGISPVNILLALLLAFIFQPVKRFFDKITNKFFYKDHYSSEDFFARLNKTIAVTTDLRQLLERAAVEIGTTLKSEQTFFFINTLDGHHVSSGTERHKQLPINDAMQLEAVNGLGRDIMVASLMNVRSPERRLMLSHRIEVILPLIRSNKNIGFLCLGERLTSNYTRRDIKVLNTISDELVIAIQNALSVQEIREFNTTLQQEISNATKELRTKNTILQQLDKAKDEFVGMASHQLRTPLTSIKGYISMVLEGDAGKISGPQAQLLNEAFTSSERMVRLINDFLNVSRLQTGKFMIDKHPADLSKVVEQEIDSLQSNAVVHGMKFVYDLPKDFPMINIDEGKMRQVIMNFADNAIYYSHDGSTILINLSVDNDSVIFTVQDTGIGVPSDEQASLFSKFYRASNARKQRPDGTGVGLYLAKKIISAHDGKIIFNSTEGKGSTFGFSLPFKQN